MTTCSPSRPRSASPSRPLTAFKPTAQEFVAIGAGNPGSGPFRAAARARIVALASAGDLTVSIART